MGMSSYVLDCVEEFWTKMGKKLLISVKLGKSGRIIMKPHEHLLQGSDDLEHVKEYGYEELWIEYKLWS